MVMQFAEKSVIRDPERYFTRRGKKKKKNISPLLKYLEEGGGSKGRRGGMRENGDSERSS